MKPWFFKYFHAATDGTDGSTGGSGGLLDTDDGGSGGSDDHDTDDSGDTQKQDWSDDWRSKISADEKHTKTLSRFASPKALFESYVSLRQKLDSGEIKSATSFPDKGTDAEKTVWRKANGVPEKAEDYKKLFKDGLVIGDQDKAFVDDFLSHAHEQHMKPEHVNGVLQWYYKFNERVQEQMLETDTALLSQTEDTLRTEWGGEYRRNINVIKGLVGSLPEAVQPLFVGARLSNGQALMNNPEIARWLLHTAMTINPAGTLVPGSGANVASAIEDEITQIEKTMRDDRKKYNSDEKMQTRLRDLYAARDKIKKA